MFPIQLTTGAVPSPPQDHEALLHGAARQADQGGSRSRS